MTTTQRKPTQRKPTKYPGEFGLSAALSRPVRRAYWKLRRGGTTDRWVEANRLGLQGQREFEAN